MKISVEEFGHTYELNPYMQITQFLVTVNHAPQQATNYKESLWMLSQHGIRQLTSVFL
jgi:hypothetical protein